VTPIWLEEKPSLLLQKSIPWGSPTRLKSPREEPGTKQQVRSEWGGQAIYSWRIWERPLATIVAGKKCGTVVETLVLIFPDPRPFLYFLPLLLTFPTSLGHSKV
jgi:hypothetical protein